VDAPLRIVNLAEPPTVGDVGSPGGVVVGVGAAMAPESEYWLQRATFTLTEEDVPDLRTIRVPSVSAALADLSARCQRWPRAATVCDDVLRSIDVSAPAFPGVMTESLAYSTLQSGPEFQRWLTERGSAVVPDIPEPVLTTRTGGMLDIRFNRPQRHNAFSTDERAGLLEALTVAVLDPSITEVVLGGNGRSFCSGGDLAEFGTFDDPASAHLARTRYSPALLLEKLTRRLGPACRAEVHGQVLGSGLEMASFCGRVVCRPGATLGLPELKIGLIPGAGGAVSVTRRIGRWRTAYLVLSGQTLGTEAALAWGLIDEIAG
jgi:enoyl-CoA hydratase/carnithine racemase